MTAKIPLPALFGSAFDAAKARANWEWWRRSPARWRSLASLFGLLPLLLALVLLGLATPARATDDNENATPTGWWIEVGQNPTQIADMLNQQNARIVDVTAENTSFSTFTVTYVRNTGAYAKAWWWYFDISEAALNQKLQENQARLISVKAYDIGGGNIRFAAVMIANTGADAKGWWWYFNETPAQLSSLAQANNARLTTLQSYTTSGRTLYATIMISNTGADAKGWWWYFNISPAQINSNLASADARLLDVTPAGNGNFNVTMESCSKGCPAGWWFFGLSPSQILTEARNNGARVFVLEPYACGAGTCYDTVMIANTPADVTACDPKGCISEAALQANICNALAGQVVGSSCLVGEMRPMTQGLARTSVDAPELAMAPSLPLQAASVAKTMTAIGILQLLAKDGLSVNTKISPYLYPDWKQGPGINQITFFELLTHTSGLGQIPTCSSTYTYQPIEAIIAGGVNPSKIGVQNYGNCNFALQRELMPALLKMSLIGDPDGTERAQASANLYIQYLESAVFQPSGVTDATCHAQGGTGEALFYANSTGSAHGGDGGDKTLECGAHGWFLSANDIFDVLSTLAQSSTLLTDAQRRQMFTQYLGWGGNCPSGVASCCPTSNDVCKDGVDSDGVGNQVWSYAGIFKCTVPVVVLMNSPLPAKFVAQSGIFSLVNAAAAAAAVPGAGPPCS